MWDSVKDISYKFFWKKKVLVFDFVTKLLDNKAQ